MKGSRKLITIVLLTALCLAAYLSGCSYKTALSDYYASLLKNNNYTVSVTMQVVGAKSTSVTTMKYDGDKCFTVSPVDSVYTTIGEDGKVYEYTLNKVWSKGVASKQISPRSFVNDFLAPLFMEENYYYDPVKKEYRLLEECYVLCFDTEDYYCACVMKPTGKHFTLSYEVWEEEAVGYVLTYVFSSVDSTVVTLPVVF